MNKEVLNLSFAWSFPVFLLHFPPKLGSFLPNILKIFGFSLSVSHWIRRFFIDWSCIFLIISSGLGVWYLGIWFFFLTFLFVSRKFFHPFHKSNTKQYWWNIGSTELAPKKEGNCNVVATWPRHVISLVITLNDIPLSPPIALTYHFCSWRLALSMHQTSFIYLLGINSPSSHCWNVPSRHPYCHPTIFPFVGKRSSLIQFRSELDLLL